MGLRGRIEDLWPSVLVVERLKETIIWTRVGPTVEGLNHKFISMYFGSLQPVVWWSEN